MSEQEMEDLLKDLAQRGFNDELLRSDIEINEAYGLPRFSISRVKEFGEERMYYKLTFQWLERSLGYEFTAIHANHRMPVEIERQAFGGHYVEIIDHGMSLINWKEYWEETVEARDNVYNFPMAVNHIDSIAQLLLSDASQTKYAGELLMYKHWPSEIFRLFSEQPEKMRSIYEHDYSFDLKEHPDITAELAYLIISERIDALEMQLEDLGLSNVLPFDVTPELHKMLKHLPAEEMLKFNLYTSTGYSELLIPLRLDKGWYQVDSYSLSITTFPEIKHGIFNGIDSERLDKKLSTVDWRNDEDVAMLAVDPASTFPWDIELLQEELFRLALDPEGKIVAGQLMLKHWLGAPYFKDFIPESAMKQLAELPVKSAIFFTDIAIDQSENLLQGRPVMKNVSDSNADLGIWERLIFLEDGDFRLLPVDGISLKELRYLVSILPVECEKHVLEEGLIKGKEVQVEAKSGAILYIKVKESADGIQLLDHNKKEIPFNFHLRSDWKPGQDQRQAIPEKVSKKEAVQQKAAPKIKQSRSKGKGL